MTFDDREKIRMFVRRLLGERDDHGAFDDGESLIQSGRLDSLAVVKLVVFLESQFAVDFAATEFDPERFDSVEAIGAIVDESRA